MMKKPRREEGKARLFCRILCLVPAPFDIFLWKKILPKIPNKHKANQTSVISEHAVC